ncbi:MAG: MBL fold metallo-hydrolase [Lachnospiraceae bacterium]|nr:MBL fold metallo-hydrolase [Lachnospiraceae bacterium]
MDSAEHLVRHENECLGAAAPGGRMDSAERLVRHGAETTGSAECPAKPERSGTIGRQGRRLAAERDGIMQHAGRRLTRITADTEFHIGDLRIAPFRISHDAAEPVCFRVSGGDKTFVLATDMGTFDDYTASYLENADVLMLEANHDIRMLQAGPYPYMLKQRILSDRGHLSNDASSELLNRVLHDRLQTIMLGHLSECNNLPELAYETVRLGIEMEESPYHGNDFRLMVADRRLPSPVITCD